MISKISPDWLAIEKHLNNKLKALREKNDSHKLNHDQTCVLRGRIAEIKELLELPNEKESSVIKKIDYDYQ